MSEGDGTANGAKLNKTHFVKLRKSLHHDFLVLEYLVKFARILFTTFLQDESYFVHLERRGDL